MKTYLTEEIAEALGCAEGEAPELVLRTADSQGRAHGGFQWPTEAGSLVEAPDWDPEPVCGFGLHGALWGQGLGSLLNWDSDALWYVVAARSADIINLNGKVKFPRCWVLFVGDQKGATDYIRARGARDHVTGAILEGGDYSILRGGYRSVFSGGDYSTLEAGGCSTLKAGAYSILKAGGDSTLEAGDDSRLEAGDNSRLSGGNFSTLRGAAYSRLTGGEYSNLTGGNYSYFTGGKGSVFCVEYFRGNEPTKVIAYVGKNGILPNTTYQMNRLTKEFVMIDCA